MAEAALVADQTEREGRDEGNDVDVGEGEEEVPEPSWSKTLERQQTEGELETNEDDSQDEKGKGLQCCSSWEVTSEEDEGNPDGSEPAEHPKDYDGGQEDLVSLSTPQLHPERPGAKNLEKIDNPRDERPECADGHQH